MSREMDERFQQINERLDSVDRHLVNLENGIQGDSKQA